MITGQTLINHSIRVRLKLSLQEYSLLDFLFTWFKSNTNSPSVKDYWIGIGCDPAEEQVKLLLSKLVQKGFLTLDHNTTELWEKEFVKDSSATFDVLYKMHQKGNKKTARERFNKVVKKVPFAELESKLKAYIASNEFQYLKGLDVWLNPAKEHWNDPIVYKDGFKPVDKNNPLDQMVM